MYDNADITEPVGVAHKGEITFSLVVDATQDPNELAVYHNGMLFAASDSSEGTENTSAQGYSYTKDEQGNKIFSFTLSDITQNQKVTFAGLKPETYAVTYSAPEDVYSMPNDQVKTNGKDLKLSGTVPRRSGYEFVGWSSRPDAVEAEYYAPDHMTYTADEAVTLYPVWTKNGRITVLFDYDGGSVTGDTSREYDAGDSYGTLPSTEKSGYSFDGWYLKNADGEYTLRIYPIMRLQYDFDHVVYAKWIADETVVNEDGSKTVTKTEPEYDDNGNKTKETTKETSYDKDGNETGSTETETNYNEDGKPTKETETTKDQDGNPTGTNEKTYEYDDKGNPTKETETTKDQDDNPTGRSETEYEYDASGKPVKKTETTYDENGKPVKETETTYDENGKPTGTTETTYDADGKPTASTEVTYDSNGNPTGKTETTYTTNPRTGRTTSTTQKYKPDGKGGWIKVSGGSSGSGGSGGSGGGSSSGGSSSGGSSSGGGQIAPGTDTTQPAGTDTTQPAGTDTASSSTSEPSKSGNTSHVSRGSRSGVIAHSNAAFNACGHDEYCPMAKFGDLTLTAWYHDGIHFCLENGIMSGYPDETFVPHESMSRAMIVAMLYRLDGADKPQGESPFNDVEEGTWYYDAVLWASENGIVSGYGDGTFGSQDSITREQLAAIYNRYAEYIGIEGVVADNLGRYTDASKVSDWALSSIQWAVGAGIVTGRTETELDPQGTATRAEAATMMMKFCMLAGNE